MAVNHGPYRQATALPTRTVAVALPRPRRPRRWYWAIPVVAGVVLLPLGGGAAMFGVGVLAYTAWGSGLARRHRRGRASQTLQQLPFPVTHRPAAGADLDGAPRELVSVVVRLRTTGAAADHACAMALELVPELCALVEDDVVTLTGWPWRGHDLMLLAEVMSTWGIALHAACGIVDVAVTWASRSGPAASI